MILTDNEKQVVKNKLQSVVNVMNEIDELKEDLKAIVQGVQDTHGIKSSVFSKVAKLVKNADKRQKELDNARLIEMLVDQLKD